MLLEQNSETMHLEQNSETMNIHRTKQWNYAPRTKQWNYEPGTKQQQRVPQFPEGAHCMQKNTWFDRCHSAKLRLRSLIHSSRFMSLSSSNKDAYQHQSVLVFVCENCVCYICMFIPTTWTHICVCVCWSSWGSSSGEKLPPCGFYLTDSLLLQSLKSALLWLLMKEWWWNTESKYCFKQNCSMLRGENLDCKLSGFSLGNTPLTI